MPHRSKHTAKRVATINTKIADFVSYRTDPYYFSSPEGAELSAIHIEVQRSIEAATDEMTFEMDPLLMKQAEEVLQQRAGRLYLYWLAVSTDKAKAWNEIIEFLKEIPHNMGGSLTDDFQPSAACKFLDLPPVSLRNLQATPD